MIRSRLAGLGLLLLLACSGLPSVAQQVPYERQVDVAPTEESIGEDYITPEV